MQLHVTKDKLWRFKLTPKNKQHCLKKKQKVSQILNTIIHDTRINVIHVMANSLVGPQRVSCDLNYIEGRQGFKNPRLKCAIRSPLYKCMKTIIQCKQ